LIVAMAIFVALFDWSAFRPTHGSGSSIRKFAAGADGAMSVVIPNGHFNDALAELTGINALRGLELLIAKDQSQTDVRCGIIDFEANHGMPNVFVDTSNVLITCRGDKDCAAAVARAGTETNPQ
jgi:hypothetical protein